MRNDANLYLFNMIIDDKLDHNIKNMIIIVNYNI
jgi:hypothetical protein